MNLDKELVKKIAKLARLELSEKEIKEFVPQLKEVLDAFSKLQEADTRGVGPSFQPVVIKNRLREDRSRQGLFQKDVLELAEHKKEGYFKGPKAI